MFYVPWYKLASPRKKFFWPAFVTRLLTPRSRKFGYGLLLGCRLGLDGGHEKTNFLCFSSSKKHEIISSDGCAHHHNRSGVVELVGREPLIFVRVENGVTKFAEQTQKTQKKSKNILDQKQQFSVGNFHFLAAGKLTFGGV